MTNKISYLDDGEFCILKKDQVEFFEENGNKVNKEVFNLSKDEIDYDKGDYKHYMSKEIDEQPTTIKNCINEYLDKFNLQINIPNFPWKIMDLKSILLIGCGTAYHSCLIAKYWFEKNTNLDVNVDIASEFRYRKNRFKKDCLYVFVSQSGETADTYAALDLCKKNQVKTCSIVNVVESSIARDSDLVLPIYCGPEIGVASTKAFLGQMLVAYLLCLKISYEQKTINKKEYSKKIKELINLSKLTEKTLLTDDLIQKSSKEFAEAKGSMFLGRGYSFSNCIRRSVKIKRVSLCTC